MHSAGAQPAYPAHAIQMVVPTAAGGNLDVVARIYGAALARILNQPVVIDNRAGAASNIGFGYVARANPDGYTLLFAGPELTVNEFLYKLPFEPRSAFVPIALAVETPVYMVARKDLPANSVAEVLALAKAHPGMLTYASAGVGSPPNLSAELFKHLGGVDILHVPYQGAAQGLNEVMAGRIDIMFPSKPMSKQHVLSGNVKLLASAGAQRLRSEPRLATVGETVPGYSIRSWAGLFAPAGTPRPVLDALATASRAILADRAVVDQLTGLGLEITDTDPASSLTVLASERAKWGALVKSGQIKATE
jgi:tripartite-type tricarboxylate transporter receptor subunit TctC